MDSLLSALQAQRRSEALEVELAAHRWRMERIPFAPGTVEHDVQHLASLMGLLTCAITWPVEEPVRALVDGLNDVLRPTVG